MTPSDEADLTSQKAGRGVIRDGMSAGRQILCLTVAVVLMGVLALIAIILSVVALGRPAQITTTVQAPSGTGGAGNCCAGVDDKIWVFAIGHDGTNLEYIDEVSGTLRGFHVDIVEAVCSVANKNCRLMWDVYENCYNSKVGDRPRAGVGLVSRWYDGCTAWSATYERIASVSFTKPFRKATPSVFYVKPGNPRGFDSSDITGKIIGFVDGFASSESCLYKAGYTKEELPAENVRHYTSKASVVGAVNDELVDAVFASTKFLGLEFDLDIAAGDPITACKIAGAGIMVRKDSKLPDWWNPAFDQLKLSTEYEKICSEVIEKHGTSGQEVDCVD